MQRVQRTFAHMRPIIWHLPTNKVLLKLLQEDTRTPVLAHPPEGHISMCLKWLWMLEGLCNIGAKVLDADAQGQGVGAAGALHVPRDATEEAKLGQNPADEEGPCRPADKGLRRLQPYGNGGNMPHDMAMSSRASMSLACQIGNIMATP